MRNTLLYPMMLLLLISLSCKKASLTIDKNEISSMAIILPANANSVSLFAAEELKKHLNLLFDGGITITELSAQNKFKKHFFIGIKPEGYEKKLNPEEGVYIINSNSVYLFGDDAILRSFTTENPGELKNKTYSEVLSLENSRTGTLFAVYNFLENEFGIRWIKPGDEGILYSKTPLITLFSKENCWTPVLVQRNIRTGSYSYRGQLQYGRYAPKEFLLTEEEALKKQVNLMTWMRRMRMGRSDNYRFGHAYTSYWESYKDTKPGIFALTSKGERKPLGRIERVKMCPSNPELAKIIVNEWKTNLQNNPNQNSKSISGCENDSDGYGNDEWCHCDKCMAMDARNEGEGLVDYVTDRYVNLWNAVLKEARQTKNDILVTGYAYENMLKPPRKVKLDDGILIEFIPRMGGDFEKTKKLYEGWRNAGMKMMMYRPNDMNWEIGIPFGQEERLFNNYKLAIMNNAVGTDFDSMLGFWEGISDMAYYILAKGQVDPQASFETLESEFLSFFGEAKGDISNYYLHWRNIFNNKILKEELKLNDGINTYFMEWHRLYRLTKRIDEFYSIEDFDKTDSFLINALQKNISDQAKNYIRRMQIANENSRLTFICFMAGKGNDKKLIIEKANELVIFRIKNKDKVDINWPTLFQYQHYQMNDQIGTRYLGFLPKELNPKDF